MSIISVKHGGPWWCGDCELQWPYGHWVFRAACRDSVTQKEGVEFQHILPLDQRFSRTVAGRCFPIASFLNMSVNSEEFLKDQKKTLSSYMFVWWSCFPMQIAPAHFDSNSPPHKNLISFSFHLHHNLRCCLHLKPACPSTRCLCLTSFIAELFSLWFLV